MSDSSRSHIPAGLRAVTPYLSVDDAAGLISFMEAALGAETIERHEDGDRVAHAKVSIDGCAIEVSSRGEGFPATTAALHLYIADVDAVHQAAVAAGATELYPPTDHDYGERGSGVRDPFGNHWWLATAK